MGAGMANQQPKGVRLGGRQKGTQNKITVALKDAILQALDAADPEGRVGYLTKQASENPVAFMTLVGKVLPMQITGDPAQPLTVITRRIIDPANEP